MSTVKVPAITGAKIKAIRLLTEAECNTFGVEHDHAYGIELDSGVLLAALIDPEGNGLGHMVGQYKHHGFDVVPE